MLEFFDSESDLSRHPRHCANCLEAQCVAIPYSTTITCTEMCISQLATARRSTLDRPRMFQYNSRQFGIEKSLSASEILCEDKRCIEQFTRLLRM